MVGVPVVSVAHLRFRHVVEDRALDLDAGMLEALDGGVEFFQGMELGLGQEQGGAGLAGEDHGVGHGQHGGRVDDDQVVDLGHGLGEGCEPVGHEQLGGIGGQDARR